MLQPGGREINEKRTKSITGQPDKRKYVKIKEKLSLGKNQKS